MRPEQKRLALTRPDGALAIMSFVTRGFTPSGDVQFERELTEEAARGEVRRSGLDVARGRVIPPAGALLSRECRDACRGGGARTWPVWVRARARHRYR